MKMKKKSILFCLLTSALISGAAVTFFEYLGSLIWVGMIPLFAALSELCKKDGLKLRHAYAYGLFYFELFYSVCFHWFTELYPLDFTGLNNFTSILVVIIAWFGLSFLQALFGALTFVAFIAILRSSLLKKAPAMSIFTYPVIYSFYEYTQTLGWWGVPWGRVPIALVERSPSVHLSSLLGSYFVTFLILTVNSLIFTAIFVIKDVKKTKICAICALSVYLSATVFGGAIMLAATARSSEAEEIRVGIVQGNFDSTEKWTGLPIEILEKHIYYIEECAKEGAELVVLCETSLPYGLEQRTLHVEMLSNTAKKYGITLLVGAIEFDGDKEYNSIYQFLPDGTLNDETYRKRHLVPFGEYVPMRSFIDAVIPFMSEISMLEDDMSPGESTALFKTDKATVGSLICFDSIYEVLAISSVRDGADLLAISTNDSWFGDSRAAYMHKAQAQLRSIELSRFTVRSANTGISCVISNTGAVDGTIPLLEEGYEVLSAKKDGSRTLYSYIGNLFVYICGASLLAPLVYKMVDIAIKKHAKGK